MAIDELEDSFGVKLIWECTGSRMTKKAEKSNYLTYYDIDLSEVIIDDWIV